MTQPYEPDPRYRQPMNLPQPYDPQQSPPPPGQQPYYPQRPYYPQQVAPKSAGIALLLSLIVPGLGTMYAGEVTWGIVIFGMWVLSWIALFFVVGFITLPIVWIVSLIAAYSAAQKWNRAHGIIS